ncbi:MAG: nucleotidyl transferase AbiEii/AbiGii toxin family protein [Alphaproteobacteria bacterium]|nr:nucleotidyl transferase AbiEii/AbiGii toxin family protein [Alphaproteobacteria bacterium]
MHGRFVLKGAMLFATWAAAPFRSTGDLDLLGFGPNDMENVRDAIALICTQPVADDGLVFDLDTLQVEAAREEEEYSGARVRLDALMEKTRIPVQIDVGFGDSVHPAAQLIDFPRLIDDMPVAKVRAYPPETVIAEKFEAMVRFGELTSRLKDHYDLWVLSRAFSFEKAVLVTAIQRTFTTRGTALPETLPAPLTPEFAARRDKLAQWEGFLRRTTPAEPPPAFDRLVEALRQFIEPLLADLPKDTSNLSGDWRPKKGWT